MTPVWACLVVLPFFFFKQFLPFDQDRSLIKRLDKKLKALALLPVITLELSWFLLNLFIVFTGHDVRFTVFKLVILFVPFMMFFLFLGRSFAWWLAAVNMHLNHLREYSALERLL